MTSSDTNQLDPYRVLFPIGILAGLIAGLLWFLFDWRLISFYPRVAHAHLMFFGFLWSFIAGFLMTAVPRMTSSLRASVGEISTAALLGALQMVLAVRNMESASVVLFGTQLLFMVVFLLRRFLMAGRPPFFAAIFIPTAIAQAATGVLLYFWPQSSGSMYLTLAGEAFVMNLIIGLGSRLIPAISRLPHSPLPSDSSAKDSWIAPLTVLLATNIGYLLIAFSFREPGLWLKAVGLWLGVLFLLRLWQRPIVWSAIGIGFKVGGIFLVAGPTFELFGLGGGVAAAHLTYLGGFGMITLLVSTRVILAHGGQALTYEISSWPLGAMICSSMVAALARYGAGANVVSVWISVSLACFLVALALWFTKYLKT